MSSGLPAALAPSQHGALHASDIRAPRALPPPLKRGCARASPSQAPPPRPAVRGPPCGPGWAELGMGPPGRAQGTVARWPWRSLLNTWPEGSRRGPALTASPRRGPALRGSTGPASQRPRKQARPRVGPGRQRSPWSGSGPCSGAGRSRARPAPRAPPGLAVPERGPGEQTGLSCAGSGGGSRVVFARFPVLTASSTALWEPAASPACHGLRRPF